MAWDAQYCSNLNNVLVPGSYDTGPLPIFFHGYTSVFEVYMVLFFYNIILHRQQKGFSLGDAPQPKNGHPHLTADSLGFLIAVPTDRINCLGQGG